MNREELMGRITAVLKDKQIRKPVRSQKSAFRISDTDGNAQDFVVVSPQKTVMYNADDVRVIIDACLQIIEESLCRGETVSIKGFGSLGLKYREKRRTKKPGTEEWVDIEGHYVPKFTCGNTLRMAARVYQMSLDDAKGNIPEPEYIGEAEDGEDAD